MEVQHLIFLDVVSFQSQLRGLECPGLLVVSYQNEKPELRANISSQILHLVAADSSRSISYDSFLRYLFQFLSNKLWNNLSVFLDTLEGDGRRWELE